MEPTPTPKKFSQNKQLLFIVVIVLVVVVLGLLFVKFLGNSKSPISKSLNNNSIKSLAKCKYLPAGFTPNFKGSSTNDPKDQSSPIGVWEGKWPSGLPSLLVIEDFTKTKADVIYFYNGVRNDDLKTMPVLNRTTIGNTRMFFDIQADGMRGLYFENGTPSASILMKRCDSS